MLAIVGQRRIGVVSQGLRQWLAFCLARDTGKWSPKTTYIEATCMLYLRYDARRQAL